MEEITNVMPETAEQAQPAAKEQGKKFVKRIPRKKVCAFCQNKAESNTLQKVVKF